MTSADTPRYAPPGYLCPFCLVVAGVENQHVSMIQRDLIERTEQSTAC